jgi:hypothetical protein
MAKRRRSKVGSALVQLSNERSKLLNDVYLKPWERLDLENPDYHEVADDPTTRQPQRERARRALAALFPGGPPDAATLPNKHLANRVNDWLTAHDMEPVGQRSIQRAAGRP